MVDNKSRGGQHPMMITDNLPVAGMPRVEFIDQSVARWTFADTDLKAQKREFAYWRGWFGFDEIDEPHEVGGNVWFVRKQPLNGNGPTGE